MNLDSAIVGRKYKIQKFPHSMDELLKREFLEIGIIPGIELKLSKKFPFWKSNLVEFSGTAVVLRKDLSEQIFVEEIS